MDTVVYLEIKKSILLENDNIDSYSVLCVILTKSDKDFGIKRDNRYVRTVFAIGVNDLRVNINKFLDLIDLSSNIFLFSSLTDSFSREILQSCLGSKNLGHLTINDVSSEIQVFLKDYTVLSFDSYAQLIEKFLVLKKVYDIGVNKDKVTVIVALNNFSINYTVFSVIDNEVRSIGKTIENTYFNTEDLRVNLLRIYNSLFYYGISLQNASYLVLNNRISNIIQSITDIRNVYTIFQCTRIPKLKDIAIPDIIFNTYNISVDADDTVSRKIYEFLRQNNDSLNLSLNNAGWFVSESGSIYTDFSKEVYILESVSHCRFGIMLDCEGDSDGSCREIGGLFYCVKGSHLHKLDAFESGVNTIQDTIKEIIEQYKRITGRYIPSKGINIITFGGSDENMVLSSLKGNSNKHLRRQVENTFRFKDIRGVIYDYINDNHIETKDLTLGSIAEALSVKVITPRHVALNDSKTLFNVLKRIGDCNNL